MREILTFILAGGKGERLDPLTRDRAKPAVPFGGIYRIIDFTLSNCINSGLRRIFVLTQYKSFSLQKHLLAGWNIFSNELGEFIDVIPAQQRIGSDWYKGTADAIYQNMYAIQDCDPELVLILAGDHIYKMDYGKLIKYHKKMKADMTVSCISMPRETGSHFGVIEADDQGRVCGFQEKPQNPKPSPQDPSRIFASMGIYLFQRDVLCQELLQDASRNSNHDFGRDIIPQMIKNNRGVYVYNFVDEKNYPKYWRDIGTRDAYYQANMDLVKENPEFNLFDRSWPVRTYHEQYPPIRTMSIVSEGTLHTGTIINSLVSGGCIIKGGEVNRSVLSPNVCIGAHAILNHSVLMKEVIVGDHCKIKNAIIDKEVVIPAYSTIGYDLKFDKRKFAVTKSGIVIVAKKTTIAF